jgi:hypothetical protein
MSKITEALINKLFVDDEDEIYETIQSLKENGDQTAVTPLMEVYQNSKSNKIKFAIQSLFYGLKSEKSFLVIFDTLFQQKYKPSEAFILSILWNTGKYPMDKIGEVIKLCLENYASAIEINSILENIEDEVDEAQMMEAEIAIKMFIEKNPKDEKIELLKDILIQMTAITDRQ